MNYRNVTEVQEQWIETQITPAPDVIIIAYGGTGGFKTWKLVEMISYEEFLKTSTEKLKNIAFQKFPSSMLVKIYVSNPSSVKSS